MEKWQYLSQWWYVKLFSFSVMLGKIYSDLYSNKGCRFSSAQPKKMHASLIFVANSQWLGRANSTQPGDPDGQK